jgi:hypothetical protein
MHLIPEQEKLIQAEENYRRGLMRSEMSTFGKRVIDAWAQRYRIAMQLELARVAKLKELRQR